MKEDIDNTEHIKDIKLVVRRERRVSKQSYSWLYMMKRLSMKYHENKEILGVCRVLVCNLFGFRAALNHGQMRRHGINEELGVWRFHIFNLFGLRAALNHGQMRRYGINEELGVWRFQIFNFSDFERS